MYLTIEPPVTAYVVFILVMIVVQGVFWFWAHHNESDKTWGQKLYKRCSWDNPDHKGWNGE